MSTGFRLREYLPPALLQAVLVLAALVLAGYVLALYLPEAVSGSDRTPPSADVNKSASVSESAPVPQQAAPAQVPVPFAADKSATAPPLEPPARTKSGLDPVPLAAATPATVSPAPETASRGAPVPDAQATPVPMASPGPQGASGPAPASQQDAPTLAPDSPWTDPDLAPYQDIIRGSRSLRLYFRLRPVLDSINDLAFRVDPVFAGGLDPAWAPLIGRLVADGFDRAQTERIFARFGPRSYTPAYMGMKVAELHGAFGIGIRRDARTTPHTPPEYDQPVPDVTVGSCLEFMREHADTLEDIKKRHGVSANTILAILLVETAFGCNLGHDVALRALASMAATDTPEKLASGGNAGQARRVHPPALAATLRTKSDWAYKEVKALLRHAEDSGLDPGTLPGSFYGAIGLCQFMPSNIELFGVDGDQDGVVDLFSVTDALYSVANYLEANGWRGARTPARQRSVILTYNNDGWYAASVLAVAKRLDLALQGKVSPRSSATGGIGYAVPSARLDPSLRRLRPPPARARVKSLGDYTELLRQDP